MKHVNNKEIEQQQQIKDPKAVLAEKKPSINELRGQLKGLKTEKKRLKQQIAQLEWEGAFQSVRMRLPTPLPSQGYREVIWQKIKNILRNEGIICLIKKGILNGGIMGYLLGRKLTNMQFGTLAYGIKRISQIVFTKNKKQADPVSVAQMISPEVQIKNYDIICFSIIDWFFRFQRPQQILSQFAKNGSRVFYINPKFYNKNSDLFLCAEIQDNIFDVSITADPFLIIYQDVIDETSLEDMIDSVKALKEKRRIVEAIMIVQLPFWQPLAKKIKEEFGWKIIYDCMDEHSGFSTTNNSMLSRESLLASECDLLITSSRPLYAKWKNENPQCILLPNAADFEHFSKLPPNDLLKKIPKPIIGYYGAISEWFDNSLIEFLAKKKKDWSFVFIGHRFGSNLSRLEKMANVHFLGEKPYQELPAYLYWFDVCIIPFKLNELTRATNPVKFYEFMSSGKKVVSVELPELLPHSDYLCLAKDQKDFLQKITTALTENDPGLIAKRIQLARKNTWEERHRTLSEAIRDIYPKVSIIVVTYNNLPLTKLCLESIFSKSHYPNYEVIVVDNNSNDGTQEYLQELTAGHPQVKVIFNPLNEGFAKANNQGILASSGDYIFFLNNDTIVTRGWLTRLLRHLQDEKIGLVGPVTNSSGNESKIEVPYQTAERIEGFSEDFIKAHSRPENFDIMVLAMFCIGMRRRIIDEVGLLDEQFKIGMFEDDDFAHRVRLKGYRVVCAEDVFIHHFGEASFNKLKETGEYGKIFEENKRQFEKKWNMKWESHKYREAKT